MRRFLTVLMLSLMGLFLLTGCGKEEPQDDHIDVEPDGTVLSGTTIEGLEISQLSIVYENNVSKLVANVTNANDSDYELRVISIKLFDEDDEVLVDTTGYIGNSIKAGETKQLIAEVTKDLKSAKRVEYEVLK